MPGQSSQAILSKRGARTFLIGAVFFCVFSGNYCFGQVIRRVLVTAPREYQRVLDLAQRDLDNQEYASAIERLEGLLHGEGGDSLHEDFFVGAANSARYELSLRSRAERMLANLPPKARELYELQFGADAQQALDLALKEFDVERLSDVRRRYAATDAGMIASMILGRHYLNAQRPMAAMICFKQLYESDVAQQKYGAELSLLMAIAARRAGQTDVAEKTLVQLKQKNPSAEYEIGHRLRRLFTDDADAISWLDSVIGEMSDRLTIPVSDWLTHRGNNQRNAESNGSMPLLNYLWEVNITTNPQDIDYINELREESRERVQPLIPSIQPLVTADTAFIRGPRRLVAVDIGTGKRIWDFSWYRQTVDITSAQSESVRKQQVRYRLLEDAVYGRLASDGELLFLIGQPRTNQANYQTFQRNPMGVQFGQMAPSSNRPNLLIALDIAAEGKYRWKVGGRTGEQESALAGVFFLGPPIVVGNELYVIGDRNNEISLYALDRATGKLRWTQQLAHSDPRSQYMYFSQRRRAGAVPSYANGVLVCPTSSGAIVAVDVASRSLLWGYQYPIERTASSSRSRGAGSWIDSSVTISDGKVLLTAVESPSMRCLNLADGKSVWTRPVQRSDKLFVACVWKGIVGVVGKHYVTGFDLETGEQKWSCPINNRATADGRQNLPAGFGFRSGDHYFLPTTNSLLKINVITGKIDDAIAGDEMLGNVVPYDDKIVSVGLDYLRLYHQTDRLAEAVAKKLEESPDDPWALEQQGALFFEAGDVVGGLASLRKAIESYPFDAPERDRAKSLLVTVALVALEKNYVDNTPLAEELEKWIDRPEDRQQYLLLRANGMLASKRPRQAFDAFLELVFAIRANNAKYSTITKKRDESSQHVIRQDRSIRSGIAEALAMVGSVESEAMLAELKSKCDELMSQGDLERIRAAINELGDLPVVDEMRLYVADKLWTEEAVVAELLLLPVLDSVQPRLAAAAYCKTAEIYAASDFHLAAARCYSIARERWPDIQLKNGKTVSQLLEQFPATSSVGKYLRSGPRWSYGATTFGEIPKTPRSRVQSLLVRLVQQKSDGSQHIPELDFWHDRNDFVATDRLGRERTRFSAGTYRRHTLSTRPTTARQLGSLCFVNVGNLIAAVDNLQPIDPTRSVRQRRIPILWPEYQTVRQNQIPSANIGRPPIWKQPIEFPRDRTIYEIATASFNGVVYLRDTQLLCVDPLTGDELWTQSGIKSNSRVWGDDQHVLVAGSSTARVFKLSDGTELPSVDIPTLERRWASIGRNVVTWDNGRKTDTSTTRILCLFDPLTQKNKWTRECVYTARRTYDDGEPYTVDGVGCIADNRFALIIEPGGRSIVIDLETGRSVGECQFELPNDQKLVRAKLLVSKDQFTVAALLQLRTDPHFMLRRPNNDTSINEGFVQAISRQTGTAKWSSPVQIDRFGLFDRQPRDLPVLLFARTFKPKRVVSGVTWRSDIVCLDRRDGRLLFELADQPISSSEFRLQAASETAIDFRFPSNKLFRMQFSDAPVAPSPPATVSVYHAPPDPDETPKPTKPRLKIDPRRILDQNNPFEFGDP